ncbi:MAG TPA: 3D domain-containing protein [Candidatus Humimicrobiaceae bacterium]|nr:3D domain-containing protein [Candidatus Humimicrobiaceae bacterium]
MTKNLKYISILLAMFSLFGILKIGSPEAGIDSEAIFTQNLEFSQLYTIQDNSLLAIASPSNPEPEVAQKINVVVTAYSSTPWETWGDPFITAAGTGVREGVIANNLLPFGTKVRLPEIYGDKVFVVEDRMNSRIGYYHVDIWLPSYWEALNFGAKRTYIEVLEN